MVQVPTAGASYTQCVTVGPHRQSPIIADLFLSEYGFKGSVATLMACSRLGNDDSHLTFLGGQFEELSHRRRYPRSTARQRT
jgi:hypothetical protein